MSSISSSTSGGINSGSAPNFGTVPYSLDTSVFKGRKPSPLKSAGEYPSWRISTVNFLQSENAYFVLGLDLKHWKLMEAKVEEAKAASSASLFNKLGITTISAPKVPLVKVEGATPPDVE